MFEGKDIMINKIDEMGDDHVGSSAKTPLRADAFDISDDEKRARIEASVRDILDTLGMDLEDIQDKWLNIAYSEKKSNKTQHNRRMAGAKGVGRFSCDRLGEYLNLYAKTKDDIVESATYIAFLDTAVAVFAGLIGVFPQIVWLSENKLLVFASSGGMIFLSGLLIYLNALVVPNQFLLY